MGRNAMPEERNAAKSDENRVLNRRKFIKAMGVSGTGALGAGAFSSSMVDVVKAQSKRDVVSLDGAERHDAIAKVQSDPDAVALQNHFKDTGWVPQFEKALCGRVIQDNDESYLDVVIPFKSTSQNGTDNIQVNLVWADLKEVQSGNSFLAGHKIVRNSKYADGNEVISWDSKSYKVDSGSISTNTGTFSHKSTSESASNPSDISPEDNLPGPPGGSLDCGVHNDYKYCPKPSRRCASYDWSCVAYVASSHIGVGLGLAGCAADPSKLSCGGLFAALAAGYFSPDCPIGQNCSTVRECAPCHPCGIAGSDC